MRHEVIVVGVSAGGYEALHQLIPRFPENYDRALLVVQHISKDSGDYMVRSLDLQSALEVRFACEKEPVKPGHVYLAPPGYHLLVELDKTLSLSIDARVNFARPSVDVLFETAADAYGPHLIGVILTGAGRDGARGMQRIAQTGGLTIVQDPEDADVKGMPQAAIEQVKVDHIMTLQEIAEFLIIIGEGKLRSK